LLGGVLAATVVGPWAGCVAMTLVLFVQWAMFSDGGLFSLGANVLHMAVIGSWGGHAVRLFVQRFVGDSGKGIVIGVVIAAWVSVMAAAALLCLELRLSWSSSEIDVSKFFTLMVSFHSLIGLGEALITGVAISFVLNQRPELICRMGTSARPSEETGRSARSTAALTRTLAAGLIIALAVAAFLSPFASSSDDGLEAALHETGITDFNRTDRVPGLLEDYDKAPIPIAAWQTFAVSIAGIGGTLVVFLLAWLLGRALPAATPNLNSEAAGE
jgi:cobalt/nickel transport system permease protein